MKKVSSGRMLAIMCIFYVGANMAHPFTPTLFTNLHLPDYMFGVALACMSIMGFIMGPFWGRFADSLGKVKIMVIGCMGYALGQFLFCHAFSVGTVIFARLFAGVFCNATMICSLAYIADNADGKERSKLMAYQAALSSFFSAGGYLLGGILGDLSINLAFYVQVGLLSLTGLLIALTLREKSVERNNEPIVSMIKASNPFVVFFKSKNIMTPVVLVMLIGAATATLGATCFDNAFNYYIKAEFDFPSTYNGLIKACVGIIGFLANVTICMWIIKNTNPIKSLIAIFGGNALTIGIVLSIQSVPLFIGISIVYYIMNSMFAPIQQSLIMSTADDSNSGTVSGLFNSIRSLGIVTGSLAAGFVYTLGSKLPFVLAGAAFVFTMLICIVSYMQHTVTIRKRKAIQE